MVVPPFADLLASFGIPENGELEVSECPGIEKPHLYQIIYAAVARVDRLLSDPEECRIGDFGVSVFAEPICPTRQFEGSDSIEIHASVEVEEFLPRDQYGSLPK